jgi:hypothetical protein
MVGTFQEKAAKKVGAGMPEKRKWVYTCSRPVFNFLTLLNGFLLLPRTDHQFKVLPRHMTAILRGLLGINDLDVIVL